MTQIAKNRRGFTLIEIMISVAIVGILASIAIPNFISYQLQVKTAESRTLVGNIITTQESFMAEFENYANITEGVPTGSPSIVKRPWTAGTCPEACSRTNPTACTEFGCVGFEPPGMVYYKYVTPHRLSAAGQAPEYAVGAVADLDGDSRLGSFSYQSGNSGTGFGLITDGLSGCPAGLTAGVFENCAPARY
jgi:prepilin-type N-terminal cleavage/methylation domain-containing protein